MRHLILCREYPPAPGGGIGAYAFNISHLLAGCGEIVHVIGQLWEGAEKEVEEHCQGRLIIHRLPFEDWTSIRRPRPNPAINSRPNKDLFLSEYHPQCFSWQASLLAEKLVLEEGVDVIEAQDYEAPLYFFQLRRALRLGSRKNPPCIVHLHSPTEFIARHNDWDMEGPSVQMAKRIEDYSISSADALLCPSQFFARQATARYGLPEGSIRVIPLPIGNRPTLERANDIWSCGTICYIGRLERRKGIVEWLEAAVQVAHESPQAQFAFVGANILCGDPISSEVYLRKRIPRDVRAQFHFYGEHERSLLPRFLSRSRIAVVPSRWENFPYACIEAMTSGLPVIATKQGGMLEMIQDGQTGWLAEEQGAEGLANALRRALATPPFRIAEMGREASDRIQAICDDQKILESHLSFRNQVIARQPSKSFEFPSNLPGTHRRLVSPPSQIALRSRAEEGLSIVISCNRDGKYLSDCLVSIGRQIHRPTDVIVLVDDKPAKNDVEKVTKGVVQAGWRVIPHNDPASPSARNAAIKYIRNAGSIPLGVSFIDEGWRLRPSFTGSCEAVLRQCPEVGLVSFWVAQPEKRGRIWIKPCPSFPYQWLANDASPSSVVRMEALLEADGFPPLLAPGHDAWDLFNTVMAAGWVAVTVPEVLASYQGVKANGSDQANNLFREIEILRKLFSYPASSTVLTTWLVRQLVKKLKGFLPEQYRNLG